MKSFLEHVSEDLYQKFGEDINEIAIVANNKRPFVYLKKHLASHFNTPIWSPSFFTIQEFFAESTDLAVTDFYGSFFVLLSSYNSILKEEGQTLVSEIDFLSLGETLLRDFDQIDVELVEPEHIFKYLEDLATIDNQFDFLSDGQRLFLNNFWASISGHHKSKVQEEFLLLWRRLPLLYHNFHEKLSEAKMTTIGQVYKQLAKTKNNDLAFWPYRKIAFVGFNALSRAEAEVFRRLQRQDKALFYFDADAFYVNREYHEAGLFIRRNIHEWGLRNAFGEFPDLIANRKKSAAVYATSGKIAQVKTVHELLITEKVSRTDSAIILADESLLSSLLQSLPEVEINISMGFPLKETLLFGFVLNWLELHCQDLPGVSGKKDRDASIHDFYSHSYNLFISGENDGEEPDSEANVKSTLEQYYFAQSRNGMELLENLTLLLQEGLIPVTGAVGFSAIENALILRLLEVLRGLSESIRLAEWTEIPKEVMGAFIRKLLPGVHAPIEGSPFNGVQVMGVLESRCLDFKEVVIVGANEGKLPYLSPGPSVIPDSIRRTYSMPVLEHQDALSAYLYYRLWQRSDQVITIFNAQVGEASGECTRFVKQIEFETDLPIIRYSQIQKLSGAHLPPPLIVEKSPEVMTALRTYLSPGNIRAFSASALNLYLECPLQFFFKYIAGIVAPEESHGALHPVTIGRVVHAVMEELYEPFQKNATILKKEDIKRLLDGDILTICRMHVEAETGTANEDSESVKQIASHIALEHIRKILAHDYRLAPIDVLELENNEDYHIQFPFECHGTTLIANLHAIIDRVDQVAGRKRIVDYKTGSDSLEYKEDTLALSGQKSPAKAVFQALFYTLIYENVTGEASIEPHLYILRSMSEKGTALIPESRFQEDPEALNRLKSRFKERLGGLLSEIFDPEIPFRHNPASSTCLERDYAQFCHPAGNQILLSSGEDGSR